MLHHPADTCVDIDSVVLHPFGAVGPVMIRDACAIRAIEAPDGDRRAHDVLGDVARHAVILRGDGALGHVGYQPVGRLPETRLDQPLDRVRLERLAPHRQQRPRPCATQEIVGQGLEMLPALALGILPPTGGEQMPMGVVWPMAPMGVEPRHGAPPECLAPDCTLEILQAWRPAAHERAQHDRRVLGESRTEHRRDRQEDRPIDDPRVEALTPLADPVVDMDFGTASAQ